MPNSLWRIGNDKCWGNTKCPKNADMQQSRSTGTKVFPLSMLRWFVDNIFAGLQGFFLTWSCLFCLISSRIEAEKEPFLTEIDPFSSSKVRFKEYLVCTFSTLDTRSMKNQLNSSCSGKISDFMSNLIDWRAPFYFSFFCQVVVQYSCLVNYSFYDASLCLPKELHIHVGMPSQTKEFAPCRAFQE